MKFSMRSCNALRQPEEIPPDLDPCIESCNSVTTRRKTVRADMRRTIAEEGRRGSFSMYSEEVDAHEPLSAADEQRDLFAQMKKAGKSKNKGKYIHIRNVIMARSLRLVIREAKRIRHKYPYLPFEDMVQAGNFGLLRAIEKFDLKKGKKFSTYAMWWIRSFIHENCMKTTGPMRVPIDVWTAERRIEKIENWPDVENTELAERTGVGVETVEAVKAVAGRRIVPLDKVRPGSDGHDSSWHSFVADGSRSTPEDRAIARVDCERFFELVPPDVASALVRNRLIGEGLEGIAGEHGMTRSALSMRISRVIKAGEFEAYS